MNQRPADYDSIYRDTSDYFGAPSKLLTDHLGLIRPGGRVLDVGVGQGRNALAAARAGFEVVGLDPSVEAIEQTRCAAEAEGLSIELLNIDFMDFDTKRPFDAILVFGLVQLLSRARIASLFHRIYAWSTRDTVLMMRAWHVDDPLYDELSEMWEPAGLHSFRSADGAFRTFLPRGMLRDIFLQWRPHLFEEYLGPEHSHGGGPEHSHGNVDFVAVRK